jgi:hypothetical protein
MARTFTTRFAVALAALLSFGLSDAGAQFTLIPDSVVTVDAAGTVQQYNATTGVLTGTRSTSFGTVTGLTVLGNRVYLSNTSGNVGEVDLATGNVTTLFNTAEGSNEGLGDNGVNLLSLDFNSGQVKEFTTTSTGTPVQTINVGAGRIGIDGAGSRTFVADFNTSGNILEYNQSGTLVNTITTGLPAGVNSGLGYDPIADTYWLATGNATVPGALNDKVLEFSPSGAVLTNITVVDVVGLDFVPVPEPGSCLAVAAAVLGLGAAARRRLRRPAATG